VMDDGWVELNGKNAIQSFVERCRAVRYWERTTEVDRT
jgi:hypothetical protein